MANDEDAPQQPGPQPPRPSPGNGGAAITAQTYEAMWATYRDGARTRGELERRHGVSAPTARRAIQHGWPARGFKPLKARALEHDQQRAEAERKVAADKFKEATDAWYRAGKQFNRVADNAVVFCIAALQQVSNLALQRVGDQVQLRPLTRWVRRRDVQVVEGQRQVRYFDEEVPLTVQEAVKVQRAVLQAAALASAFKKLWPLSTDAERALEGAPLGGVGSLTEEHARYVLEHGQLPPGVSSEDVFGVDVAGFGEKPKRRSN